jgi:peptidylprolyl isomerase
MIVREIMKKFLILLLAVMLLFSGCIGQQKTVKSEENISVKSGDTIFVDYVGRTVDGKVFDTSNESVAKQNDMYITNRTYRPIKFTVGKGEMIPGFDEGVIGMKVGEMKTLTIPPEKGYGVIDPGKISTYPIIESIPATKTIPSVLEEIPAGEFESLFGQNLTNLTVGDKVRIPGTNINLTVKSISANVSLAYDLTVGYKILETGAEWNQTVVSIDGKNITTRADVKKNDIVQEQGAPWNTTVINVNSTTITIRHNAIPDTEIPTMSGGMRIHFNETAITIDQNNKFAGKTLIFEFTLISIA